MRRRGKTKLKTARLDAISQVGRAIALSLDPQQVVDLTLKVVGSLMEGVAVQVWRLHEQEGILIPLGTYGLPTADRKKPLSIPVGQGVVGRVAASRRPIAVEDLRGDPRAIPANLVKREGLISFLGVPLVREEKLFGVLSILTRTPYRFDQKDMRRFASFAQQVAIALEHAYRYQDLQRSYEELLAAQAEFARKTRMTAIAEIGAAISHDVRNFLAALRTCIQILQSNPHLTGRDAELLDIIQDGSQWFAEVISQISALGVRPPQFQEVDLHELIDETFASLQRDDRCPASIAICRQFDTSIQKIQGEQDQLGQVFRNLFLNAVQAMEGHGKLQVETHRIDSQIKILIRDTGTGIAPTVLPNIFEPFYSTKSGHLGLGLAIVRHIVQEHGGQITADSEQQMGACLVMVLPLEP